MARAPGGMTVGDRALASRGLWPRMAAKRRKKGVGLRLGPRAGRVLSLGSGLRSDSPTLCRSSLPVLRAARLMMDATRPSSSFPGVANSPPKDVHAEWTVPTAGPSPSPPKAGVAMATPSRTSRCIRSTNPLSMLLAKLASGPPSWLALT